MRADNRGEGGILALMSLIGANSFGGGMKVLTGMGLLGAALIYGDGVITPAISVLSALEGVNVVTASLKPYVMPLDRGHPASGCSPRSASARRASAGHSARSCCCGSW